MAIIKKDNHKVLKHEVKDNDYDAIIKLEPTSQFDLKARVGHLTAFDMISNREVKIKFKKSSMLYKLLAGYSDIKIQFRKTRLLAVEIDESGEAKVLEGKHLQQVEKKYKRLMTNWSVLFKDSLGIK